MLVCWQWCWDRRGVRGVAGEDPPVGQEADGNGHYDDDAVDVNIDVDVDDHDNDDDDTDDDGYDVVKVHMHTLSDKLYPYAHSCIVHDIGIYIYIRYTCGKHSHTRREFPTWRTQSHPLSPSPHKKTASPWQSPLRLSHFRKAEHASSATRALAHLPRWTATTMSRPGTPSACLCVRVYNTVAREMWWPYSAVSSVLRTCICMRISV